MRRRGVALAFALVLALPQAAAPAAAQQALTVLAFGDSIVAGGAPFDEEGLGGWPGRLQTALREGGSQGARVENHGVGGETTAEGLLRVDDVVNRGGDVFILNEGTNDVTRVARGEVVLGDVITNIALMLEEAEEAGLEAIPGTVIPRKPGVPLDDDNEITYELVLEIREQSAARQRRVADFFHLLPFRERRTFRDYYYDGRDSVGHPNAAGFAKMAELVAGILLQDDAQSPVEGRLRSPSPGVELRPATTFDLEIFDFEANTVLATATLLLNGEPLDTAVTGNRRRARLKASNDGQRRCQATLSVRAEDRAEPPNVLDYELTTFAVADQEVIRGDVNGDCRVDGRDLTLFGFVFGLRSSQFGFDPALDFVPDGVIDGEDLARLARNFGRGEL